MSCYLNWNSVIHGLDQHVVIQIGTIIVKLKRCRLVKRIDNEKIIAMKMKIFTGANSHTRKKEMIEDCKEGPNLQQTEEEMAS